ncbi:MAG TPA: DUF2252 domain-containing protein [Kineosporiaceae bacterium]|nr:DUF2252 domain-containing protein [Kineosporiaceae bacterium]
MTQANLSHPSLEERRARGEEARRRTPPSVHAGWRPASDRPDPVTLLEEQNLTREPDLVPVRHGRMIVSPFTFYRGTAKIMATDLAATPVAGLDAQLCGDAHLSNFGVFASPERRLLFDLNDFDETLPGPVEYDVERMTASFVVAARNNRFPAAAVRDAALAAVTAYRTSMTEFAQMGTLDVWYARLDEDRLRSTVQEAVATTSQTVKASKGQGKAAKKDAKAQEKRAREQARRAERATEKARTRDSLQALSKLAELVDGRYRIVSQPPVLVPARELGAAYHMSADEAEEAIRQQLRAYRATLQDDRRLLLERFEVVDFARKVVGVGSVGTRAFVVLLEGRDAGDALFLQVKEATMSVLEAHLPRSRYGQHGERVVQGQRRMQAASDIFLGWTMGVDADRHFYWRQLRDMKGSAQVEEMSPEGMGVYADLCGWTLARAHARSGDPVAIAAYLGDDAEFDAAMTEFALRYADQNEQDYEAFVKAVRSGRLVATEGV